MSEKYILDATCGSRGIWFEKNHPNALYMDCRKEYQTSIWKSGDGKSERVLNVEPDVIASFTSMPFENESFYLVVFDPPHLIHVGDNAWLKKKYGRLPEEWPQMIHDGFNECMRVLKPYGTLIFKWSEVQVSTRDVINAIGKEPLFGHRSGKAMNTHWLCYMKIPHNYEQMSLFGG
ncbi:MAG: class I SAM-dependent methyltransferase [Lachnospiraceae bacterium]|nr:class I SAM-dependent methyltransferase [Lachnospiraceae bacterium]